MLGRVRWGERLGVEVGTDGVERCEVLQRISEVGEVKRDRTG